MANRKMQRTSIHDLATVGYELSEEDLRLAVGGMRAKLTYVGRTYLGDGSVHNDYNED